MTKKNYRNLKDLDKTDEEYIQSVNDLVNIVKTQPKERTEEYTADNEIFEFIESVGLKAGTNFIPNFIIYAAYVKWAKGDPANNPVSFFKYFSRKFVKKKRSLWNIYGLSKDNFKEYKGWTVSQFKELKLKLQEEALNGDAYASEGGQANDSEE